MKKIILFLIASLLLCASSIAQITTLTFTGKDTNEFYVRLDRVVITNLTKNWTETIYYPDTVLIMGATGIEEAEHSSQFSLFKNIPNPFAGVSEFSLQLKESQKVIISLFDAEGRKITTTEKSLLPGEHTFRLLLSTPQTYVLHVCAGTEQASLTVINTGNAGSNRIEYLQNSHSSLKILFNNMNKGQTANPFDLGDEMEYYGYAIINDTEYESEHIRQSQLISEHFELLFMTSFLDGHPCIGTPKLTDIDGNTYNTIQLGTQCWMKENLRTTRYADGTLIPIGSSTSTIVAYRYNPNDTSSNVSTYGYLYNWSAVMGSSTSSSANPSGVQGVCPDGWHLPSDAEWEQLYDYIRSQSTYHCGGNRYYIAKSVASQSSWSSHTGTCTIGNTPSTNNATGFDAHPSGSFRETYNGFGSYTILRSATESTESSSTSAWTLSLRYDNALMIRACTEKYLGLSVRCVLN